MTTIYERVANALATLSPAVPYAMAPYKTPSGAALPDLFLAYSLSVGNPEEHADNVETLRSYQVQISIYKMTGLVGLPNVDAAMVAAGFQRGSERQLPQDPDTGHYGLAKNYVYVE